MLAPTGGARFLGGLVLLVLLEKLEPLAQPRSLLTSNSNVYH